MNLSEIQSALTDEGVDGWLFFDHHARDSLAYRILGLAPELQTSRRWYYFIPAEGTPRGLLHRIEPHVLDSLPGEKAFYSKWPDQVSGLKTLLRGARSVAMQFSPDCVIPYVSMVDGGTIDLIRSTGVKVKSSANLIQLFEARWTEQQLQSHLQAGRKVDNIRAQAFQFIRERIRTHTLVTEWEICTFIRDKFHEQGMVTDHGPIVAVNQHASDPHYEPKPESHSRIEPGDLVLVDMWAKLDHPDAVYYDITWTGFCQSNPPEQMQTVFGLVTAARDLGVSTVLTRALDGLRGFELDDVVRQHITSHGYGEYFVHRTGHSIGTTVHGSGANIDNFETHDERVLIPQTCFSIEPGIYLPDFGIRSEVNVFIGLDGARVTGEIQRELLLLH